MRILYVDIDSLRPDHLGCYGYSRNTSPVIDRIASQGVRFTNCHASDAPCLPSRSALFSGRCGYRTGVVNHGGTASQPFRDGPAKGMRDWYSWHSWPAQLRRLGMHTVDISPFGERHSAWHYLAGFNEVINTGGGGMENADVMAAQAIDWIERKGANDNWFMHLNFWDPHTPYRVPDDYGNPFEGEPHPDWINEEIRKHHWEGSGSHSAREVLGFEAEAPDYAKRVCSLKRQPLEIDSQDAVTQMFDGYDVGVRYADDYLGRVLAALDKAGILDETAIIISADHGENLGELNIYGDHQTADAITCNVPLIIRWPGVTDTQAGRVDDGLHYHFDFAATSIELAGGSVSEEWDGRSFAEALRAGRSSGREELVLSQAAWCTQRAVRWDDFIYLHTYDDAWHDYPETMLFDLASDPHETTNLAETHPELVAEGRTRLKEWLTRMDTLSQNEDPVLLSLNEGGGLHAKEGGEVYLQRLENTGRTAVADRLRDKRTH